MNKVGYEYANPSSSARPAHFQSPVMMVSGEAGVFLHTGVQGVDPRIHVSEGSRNCGLRLDVHPQFSHASSLTLPFMRPPPPP